MSFDRKQFDSLMKERSLDRTASRMPQLLTISAAAPKAEALTHDDKWDSFLSYLTGIKEKLNTSKQLAQNEMNNPSLVNSDELMRQKIIVLINDAQMQMIDVAINLPKALMESSEAASKIIENFEQERKKRESA